MAAIARDLSRGFGYMRVDLYSVRDRIYFGELTPFHQGGLGPITPPQWEDWLGEMWGDRSFGFRRQPEPCAPAFGQARRRAEVPAPAADPLR